ncbi:TonB-dependent receptor [Azoarcus sp. L1K30]|uniref:TonB-dependent receptor domain-containing protein n=1 Tax=Azoarcus sp. L1K30 TaxID=2820277 RepID=UPI001B815668|nr:TonB-dependent receptor [Azoarcus sp. L1K30]
MKIQLSMLASACALVYPLIGQAQQTGHANAELDQVVVTATRQPVMASDALASVEVISRDEITKAGNTSLVELLSARSGIQVSATGGAGSNTSIFIRGANAGHTLVLIDGMRVGSVTNGAPTLETIPLALIDHVEILRGPASALYGSDAIGGVIQIFTRKGKEGYQPSLRVGVGSDNSRELEAAIAGGVDRLRYSLVAGQERTDGFNARPKSTAGSNRDDDGFRNDYMSGSLALGIGERDEVGVSVLHTDGRNWYDAGEAFDSSIKKQTDAASVHLRNQITRDWTSTLRLGYSADVSRISADGVSTSRFDTDQTQFSWQNDVALAGGSLLAAYEYLEQDVSTTADYAKTNRSSNSLVLGWGGQFGQHSVQFNARHDDDSQFGGKTTGSAAYGYQFHPEWRVHGSIGTAFKAPTFNDLYYPLECYPGFGCFGGNQDLKPEDAVNREIGLVWEHGVTVARATYFNNRVKNLIDWSTGIADNVATATLEGVELGVSTMVYGYRLRASVDFLEAKDKDSGDYLGRRAKESATFAIDRSMGAWTWGAELTGQGRRFDRTTNTAANKLGGYALLNAYVHYAVARDWSMELRANNILDKDYERAQGYGTAGANAFVSLRYALH